MTEISSKDMFGNAGAGILVMAQNTGRLLAMKRSTNVQQPRTWGIPGGKMEADENPVQSALRELREEIGYQGDMPQIFDLETFETPDGGFRFYNHLVLVPDEFIPEMDHESENFRWIKLDEWPEPAHFGMEACLFGAESRRIIDEVRDTYVTGNTEWAIAQKHYPPVLYHILHDEPRGDALLQSQANDKDEVPYVYATSNPVEALPYLTPNGTRIVNGPVPGSEDVFTIIPGREKFLSEGKMEGRLLRFMGDGFEQQYIDGEPTTQWVSKDPVPFDKMQDMGPYNMTDAMYAGLQVLFTDGPVSYEEAEAIYGHPDFPHNIPDLVARGELIHENAAQGINPSSFISPAGKRPLPPFFPSS